MRSNVCYTHGPKTAARYTVCAYLVTVYVRRSQYAHEFEQRTICVNAKREAYIVTMVTLAQRFVRQEA